MDPGGNFLLKISQKGQKLTPGVHKARWGGGGWQFFSSFLHKTPPMGLGLKKSSRLIALREVPLSGSMGVDADAS